MTTIVNVTYHEEESSWWAESDDVEGFSAAGDSLEEVRELTHEGIPFALGTSDVDLRESREHCNPVLAARLKFRGFENTSDFAPLLALLHPAATNAVAEPYGLSHDHDRDAATLRLHGLTTV